METVAILYQLIQRNIKNKKNISVTYVSISTFPDYYVTSINIYKICRRKNS